VAQYTPAPTKRAAQSGMKATANGALNLSVLDWMVGRSSPRNRLGHWHREEYATTRLSIRTRSGPTGSMILLEKRSFLFYERGRDRLPRGWIGKMKIAIHPRRGLCPRIAWYASISNSVISRQ
jgi:starch phosphorylase